MTKLKIAGFVLAVLISLGVGYKLAPSPGIKTKTVYVDRVQVVDRVVNKDVVVTETRPDGTKIVTVDKSNDTTRTVDTDKTKTESKVTAAPLSKYSLGISLRPESLFPFKGIYTAEVGRRLWDTPIFATASFNTKREFTVGLMVIF